MWAKLALAAIFCILAPCWLAAAPQFDHIVIVIEENHSNSDIFDSANAPFINWLADRGARFDNFYAIAHPSQPNYLEFFSGSDQGVRFNNFPPGVPFTTPNLGASLTAAGLSFVSYAQGLPEAGSDAESAGDYARKHNPAANWQSTLPGPNQIPRSLNQPFTAFPTDFNELPAVSLVVPDLGHDMHDGSIREGDQWLQANLGAYARWAQDHNSLLIVTWDEDSFRSVGNRIPTLFYGANVAPTRLQSAWTLHNLLRTVEDLTGIPHSGRAAAVQPIAGAWAGDAAQATRDFRNGRQNYQGAHDTFVRADMPDQAFGTDSFLIATRQADRITQSLIRFDDLFGDGQRQIKTDREILSAKLVIPYSFGRPISGSFNAELHRMLVDWNDQSTWNSLGGGVRLDDSMAAEQAEFTWSPGDSGAGAVFDVTQSVRLWKQGAPNRGWVLVSSSEQMYLGLSNDDSTKEFLPYLSITYALASNWRGPAAGIWSQPGNWSNGVPVGPESTAIFDGAGNTPRTIAVTSPTAVGGIVFDSAASHTLAGNSPIQLVELGRTPSIDVRQSSHTIAAPLVLESSAAITTAPGSQLLLSGPVSGSGRLVNQGLGQLVLAGPTTVGRVMGQGNLLVTGTLTTGQIEQRRLTVTGAVVLSGAAAAASIIDDLQLLGGSFDLGNDALVLRPSAGIPAGIEMLQTQLASGFAGGHWNGTGLFSSLAALDATHQLAVGMMPSDALGGVALPAIFAVPPGETALLVRTTLYGDANLDGLIDALDYSQVAAGLQNGLSGWWNGDFNYDGVVDGTDFALLDNAYHFQTSGLAAGVLDQLRGLAVPEPSGWTLLATATSMLGLGRIGRRRRGQPSVALALAAGADRGLGSSIAHRPWAV